MNITNKKSCKLGGDIQDKGLIKKNINNLKETMYADESDDDPMGEI